MPSLAETLLAQLDGSQIRDLSRRVGADEKATGTAVQAAIPMLMAALARNAGDDQGRQALDRALERDHDGSVLDGLAGFFGKASTQEGDAILKHVLGDGRKRVEQGLGGASGLASDQAGQVLAMVAPLVLGALGRTKRQEGLDAGALAGLLAGEGRQQEQALGGLVGFLDRDGDGSVADDVLGGLARGLGGKLFGR